MKTFRNYSYNSAAMMLVTSTWIGSKLSPASHTYHPTTLSNIDVAISYAINHTSYYMGRIQFKDSKYMLNIYVLTFKCPVLNKRNKPPYPIFLFPVLTPGKRLPRPGLSNGLTPGDGVGCFIGVGNPIPGDGVGVAN